jgi:gluconolactonase
MSAGSLRGPTRRLEMSKVAWVPSLIILVVFAFNEVGCGGSNSGGSTGHAGSTGAAGSGTAGTGATGAAGTGTAGSETAGTGAAGSGTAGTGTAGTGTAGAGGAGSGTAGTGATGTHADAGTPGTGADAGEAGSHYKKEWCPPGPYPAPMGSNRQNVCVGFKYNHTFNEGPVWIGSQAAFFFSNFDLSTYDLTPVTKYDGDIIKYTPATGQCEVWLADVGTNGLGVAPDGNLLATSQNTQSITEFDLVTKQPTIIADHYMGKRFNSPNDIIVHSNGTIYFSDPTYLLGNRPQELPTAVYRIDPTGAISQVATGGRPNGVTLSPDEKRLYVEQNESGLQVYDLDANGVPTAGPRPFRIPIPPMTTVTDGLAVDCAGNVYLAFEGFILAPDGKQLGTIPGGGATNPTFGGVDGKTLIVVGGGSVVANGNLVATVQMNLPGIH